MKKIFLFMLGMVALVGIAACQAPDASQSAVNGVGQDKASGQKVNVDHGIPSSSGPTSAPAVKGPDSAPPGVSANQAQAITTNENIRLTLPRKTQ